jgi:hypothetical protein
MKAFKFTKATIDALPPAPEGKQVEYCDAMVHGAEAPGRGHWEQVV